MVMNILWYIATVLSFTHTASEGSDAGTTGDYSNFVDND